MLRLLIVEDEKYERECLLNYFDWSSFGFGEVVTAFDGIDGYEKAMDVNPDIIITDIKMPGIDGLTMINNIKNVLPEVKTIILTGYDDFILAKEAIRLNANGYILKPLEEKELVETINRTLEACKAEKGILDHIQSLETKVEEGVRKARRIRISALLDGLIDKDQTDELIKDLEMDGYHDFRAVALKLSDECRETANIISDLLSKDYTLFKQDETEPTEFIICISGVNTPEQLIERVNDRIKTILKGTNGRVSYAGTGQTEDNVQSLSLSRKQASSAMQFAEFWDIGTLLPFEYTVEKTVEFDGRIGEFLTKCNYYTKQLLYGVRSSDHDNVMSIIIEMFEYYKSVEGAGYDLIRNHIFNTFSETLLELYSLNSSIYPVNLEDLTQWNRVLDMKRLKDIKMLTFRFYENAMCFMMEKKGNRDESIIKKALELIREKPAAEVSLKTLAGELLLSPNYLGTIFRKTVGKPFNEYLNEYRMEKAKELLTSTENNVAWVSREVGLFNTSYFCSLFKEAFGITPGEYHDLATRK